MRKAPGRGRGCVLLVVADFFEILILLNHGTRQFSPQRLRLLHEGLVGRDLTGLLRAAVDHARDLGSAVAKRILKGAQGIER